MLNWIVLNRTDYSYKKDLTLNNLQMFYAIKPKQATNQSSIPGSSPSDCLPLYPGYLSGMSYPSAEMQSVDSVAPSLFKIILEWKYLLTFHACVKSD